MNPSPGPKAFLTTVWLLWKAARTRAAGRRERQRQLLQQKTKGNSIDWGALGTIFSVLMMALIHAVFAWGLLRIAEHGLRSGEETSEVMVVSARDYQDLIKLEKDLAEAKRELELEQFERAAKEAAAVEKAQSDREADQPLELSLEQDPKVELLAETPAGMGKTTAKAERVAERQRKLDQWPELTSYSYKRLNGGDFAGAEEKLRAQLSRTGSSGFAGVKDDWIKKGQILDRSPLPLLLAVFMLGWWLVMMMCQGEGVEMDLQRRRHPMWEWLLGHPVKPGAVFFAEMLSPLVANPVYIASPAFWGILFWNLHDATMGVRAALLIGVPMALAMACAGKALEVWAMLRLSLRSRGAVLGIISWLAYVLLFTPVFLSLSEKVGLAMARAFRPLAGLGEWDGWWWLLGFNASGDRSLTSALMVYWPLACLIGAVSVGFSAWAANRGLAGGFASEPEPAGAMLDASVNSLGGNPLFRKELLWFKRDRGAIIQVILIPVTMAAFQLFNFRYALEHVLDAWYWMCGTAVMFGTYFLFILGPRSLASEGPALWMAWTWPQGMEELLKAKARLWSMLASVLVFLVLGTAVVLFPADWWQVMLVGVGWYFFSHSLAQKSVTLVMKPSDSGEPEPAPRGRQWAASLGTFTFAIGILTQQWTLALVGIVYSWLTAAAMWQNFRARLPFLFDPWSERLPPPPTLMHSMIAISIMVEVVTLITGIIVLAGGKDSVQMGQTIAYALTAVVMWGVMNGWLENRGVSSDDIWHWPRPARPFLPMMLGVGLVGGALLGLLAVGYVKLVMLIPGIGEPLLKMQEQLAADPVQRKWLGFLAIVCAPLAEEYLFRGLLYRALDREWGGWRAVLGSAAFFAIYHPPTSWLPVAVVGVACALIFKFSGRLWPAVLLHLAYNSVVVYFS
jgi:membrane protease YdiL (CAAX protease family)